MSKKISIILFLIFFSAGCARLPVREEPLELSLSALKGKRIVVDPGHGGKDPGAISASGLQEKTVVLDIARRIKGYLEVSGAAVFLTRERDVFLELEERAEFARKANADVFISIHANANTLKSFSGVEVYKLTGLDAGSQQVNINSFYLDKLALAQETAEPVKKDNGSNSFALASNICENVSRMTGLDSLGVKSANFHVLRKSSIPSVLVEVGFLSNTGDAAKLSTVSFRDEAARAIAVATAQYFRGI